jgi:hypothetical protein
MARKKKRQASPPPPPPPIEYVDPRDWLAQLGWHEPEGLRCSRVEYREGRWEVCLLGLPERMLAARDVLYAYGERYDHTRMCWLVGDEQIDWVARSLRCVALRMLRDELRLLMGREQMERTA